MLFCVYTGIAWAQTEYSIKAPTTNLTDGKYVIVAMKIKQQYKVREMAGEHVVIMQGKFGTDMTRIISLNESALYLWNAIYDKEFNTDIVANLLAEHYGIDDEVALRDATRWVDKLDECGLLE